MYWDYKNSNNNKVKGSEKEKKKFVIKMLPVPSIDELPS